ncbi:unnamed protein product [Calypogeia fissa]
MKSAVFGVVLLVVIQLFSVALAANQVVDGPQLCDWEGVARSCGEFFRDGEGCCQALAAANDGGCSCSEGTQVNELWIAFGREVCKLEVFHPEGAQCSPPEFVDISLARERSSRLRGVRKLEQEQVSFETEPDAAAEDAHNEGTADEEKITSEGFPGIMAAGFIGSVLLSCVYVCPCWAAKKKDNPSSGDSFKEDYSINSISSSHDNSRSLGRSIAASFSGSFSTTGAHLPAHPTGGALTFTMAELVKVTSNFSPSHKIGQGGFGTVYKGKLRDGTVVAVKRAKKDAFEARLSVEFQNELDMLSQVDHLNLVKLIGYLEEEHERIIVVEFVSNGNLREHLDGQFGSVLDMATRLDVAIDIAHALTYLHNYADRPIIHRDVKASNILLTDTCRAKVADFGFSRTGPTDQGATHVSTQVKGTAGYLDPEYLTTYQLNQKSDVYSFGILLIEIFTGRRPIELKRPSDERVTVRWAFKKFVEGKVMDILDPRLERTSAIHMVMERLAELAFACSAPTKNDRPSMKKAQEALWHIRKDYQGQNTSASPASRGPGPSCSMPQSDSRGSPAVMSPYHASPSRSTTPTTPVVHQASPSRSTIPVASSTPVSVSPNGK